MGKVTCLTFLSTKQLKETLVNTITYENKNPVPRIGSFILILHYSAKGWKNTVQLNSHYFLKKKNNYQLLFFNVTHHRQHTGKACKIKHLKKILSLGAIATRSQCAFNMFSLSGKSKPTKNCSAKRLGWLKMNFKTTLSRDFNSLIL